MNYLKKEKGLALILVLAVLLALGAGAAFAVAPAIDNAYMDYLLDTNYIRVVVNFSEGIYADEDGTAAVSKDDFALTVNRNGGAVSAATINAIRTTGNGDPAPGSKNFLFYIDLVGGPPSGTETITIKPTVGSSVYNGDGEAMAANANAAFTLLDKRVEFAAGYPQAGATQAAGSKQVELVVKPLDEPVTAYYVVVADGADAPDADQVIAGKDSADQGALAVGSQEADSAGDTDFTATLPADATDYDAYVVIKDAAGNVAGPAKVKVRTPDASVSPTVISIAVTAQPTDLTYTEGETLDLSGLKVKLTYIGGSSEEVAFANFGGKGITTAPVHGTTLLVANHHNKPVAVTYDTYAAYTSNLTVTNTSADNVCQIGAAGYATLDAALAAVDIGETVTITLLRDINYNGSITINNGKKIMFDLNGHTLIVNNTSGVGLHVTGDGTSAEYIDDTGTPGQFNVTGTTRGVHVSDGGKATVTNAKASNSEGGIAAYVVDKGKIEIYGDAEGYFGVYIDGAGISLSSVNVHGDVKGILYGTYAHAGKIDVGGDSVSYMNNTTDCGAYAVSGGVIAIAGDARGGDYGVKADGTNSRVEVGGNAEGTEAESGYGAAAVGGGSVQITGDAIGERCGVYAGEYSSAAVGGFAGGGTYGAYAGGMEAKITVAEGVTASGDEGVGVYAKDGGNVTVGTVQQAADVQGGLYGAYAGSNVRNPGNVGKVHIFGDVVADDLVAGFGAFVENDGEVIIEGSIAAANYLNFKTALPGDTLTTVRTRGEHEYTDDLAYRLYTDDVGKVLVKENTVPQPVSEIDGQEYLTLFGALKEAEDGETIVLLSDIGYAGGIDIRDKDITFDLNTHMFNVDNPSPSGKGLMVTNGGLGLNGSGTFNVCGRSYGVYASNATVDVSNSEAGEDGIGVYATDGSTVNVAGNVTAYGDSGGGVSCANSEVTIDGSIRAAKYIKIGEGWRNESSGSPDPAKLGYIKYSFPNEDETAVVWVWDTPASGGNVCEIDGAPYVSLDEALAAVPENNTDTVTIKLLADITDNDGILISQKKITLDLNGKTLTVNNSADNTGANSGIGLRIQLSSEVNVIGGGSLNIASRMAGLSVNESEFIVSEQTSVSITSAENVGLHADTECTIVINGNVTGASGLYANYDNTISISGTVTATGNVDNNHAVYIYHPNNTVYVGSAVVSSGTGAGVYVGTGSPSDTVGSVTVGSLTNPGLVVGRGHGIWMRNAATVTVYGNVKGASNGIDVTDGCDITVYGNVTSTSTAANRYGVYGFFNSTGDIFIKGDVEGVNGICIHGEQVEVTVDGNVTASGTSVDDNAGVRASYAKLHVTGNVTATSCTGVYSEEQSEIIIDGTITATNYIKVASESKADDANDAVSTMTGYLQYSGNNATFVWVRNPVARQVTGIAIKTQPIDLTYTAGETLDLSGLVVTLAYSDATTLEVSYEDFIYMGITANPAHGTAMAVATHHNRPVTVTCNGQTAVTNNLTVTSGSSGGNSGGSSNPPAPASAVNAVVAAGNTPGTTLPVSVSNGTGTISLEASSVEALFGGERTALVTVPSIAGVRDYTLEMPASTLSGNQGGEALTMSTEVGSITLPGNMLSGGLEAETQKVGITLGQGDKSLLPEDVKEALGDRPLIRLSLTVDGQQTSWSNESAPVTVSIPYAPAPQELANPESIVIWYIDGSGNTVSVPNGRYDPATGTVTFTTTHFSYYAVGYNQVSFKDVVADAWYGKAVAFLAAREIATGTGDGNFSPEEKLTRGQFIVMLMKAYGTAPDTAPKDNFADAGNTYYTGYLAAAKRLGISAGVGNNLFVPEKEIIRQEMFTLLYNGLKTMGKLPQGNSEKSLSAFSDAGDIAPWAKDAMTLFADTGIIGGSGGKLAPADTATRAQMAQVLYVLLSK